MQSDKPRNLCIVHHYNNMNSPMHTKVSLHTTFNLLQNYPKIGKMCKLTYSHHYHLLMKADLSKCCQKGA